MLLMPNNACLKLYDKYEFLFVLTTINYDADLKILMHFINFINKNIITMTGATLFISCLCVAHSLNGSVQDDKITQKESELQRQPDIFYFKLLH